MKLHQSIFLAGILFFLVAQVSVAQESINTAGGNVISSGGSVSYSIGQVFYQTSNGANGSVSEGVQQPYEISIITQIEDAKSIHLLVSAYPNPATDYLILDINESEYKNMCFQLYDMNGKLLQSQNLTESKTQINMSNYPPASYFVRVVSGNISVKEFKIIKQ